MIEMRFYLTVSVGILCAYGITTISAILSRNIIIAVLMYGAYLGVGYIIGLFTFMVGVIRYIQIRIVMFSRKEK